MGKILDKVLAAFRKPATVDAVVPTINIIDKSTLLNDADFQCMVEACRLQLEQHVAPMWLRGAWKIVVNQPESVGYPIVIVDDPDHAGALGYHTQSPGGKVWGRVFVKPVLAGKGTMLSGPLSVSAVLSHEVIEAYCDPNVNLWTDMGNGKMVCYEACFTGETEITLLNGTTRTIESLKDEKEFWVYGCTEDGQIKPARGHSARISKKNAEIVQVELDNGKKIRCTPEHRFMMRDGSYVTAIELIPGSSLMPLYKRFEEIGKKLSYEQVMVPSTNDWQFTHRVVAPDCPVGSVRHHIDFNRYNNEPSNILILDAKEHFLLHSQSNKLLTSQGKHPFQNPSAEKRARDSKRRAEYNKTKERKEIAKKVGRAAMLKLWENPEFREHHSRRGKELIQKYNGSAAQKEAYANFMNDPDKKAAWIESRKKSNKNPEVKRRRSEGGKKAAQKRDKEELSILAKKSMHVRWHQKRNIVKEDCQFCNVPFNHKVISVTPAGFADVWDISVDDTHNFALEAGVFVHNCDPVEHDSYEIVTKDGTKVSVSNFVLPTWFDPQADPNAKFDWMAVLTRPFQMSRGGYMVVMDLKTGKVDNVFGSKLAEEQHSVRQNPSPAARSVRKRNGAESKMPNPHLS